MSRRLSRRGVPHTFWSRANSVAIWTAPFQLALPLILIFLLAISFQTVPNLSYTNASATTEDSTSISQAPATGGTESWPSDPQAAANEACTARLAQYRGFYNPWNATLAAAYPARAKDVAAEDERIRGPNHKSPFRAAAPGEFLSLCYFDADAFGIASSPEHPIPPGAHNRLKEVVRSDGIPYVLVAGRRESIRPDPLPSSGNE